MSFEIKHKTNNLKKILTFATNIQKIINQFYFEMSAAKNLWGFIRRFILNKYVVVLLGFGVYVTFFDVHNLLLRWETGRKINELQKEYDYYKNEIKENKEKMNLIQNDDAYLEKIAREKYHMKSKDEEVFIIEE